VDTDTKHLVRKLRAGADFAIAQLFFEPEDFLRLRDRVDALGCDTTLLPGLMPLTTPRTLAKTIELSGADVPASVARKLDPFVDDPAAFRKAGVDLVAEMGERLLAEGVPGLHFYTLNRSKATREVVARLGLIPART
jgi:methylenetetrahydrofolate reductase (NADPH)